MILTGRRVHPSNVLSDFVARATVIVLTGECSFSRIRLTVCRNGGPGYQVQNSRQFVCELEQHSQVRKLIIVTHARSESQLDQLERLKGDRQRIELEYQFSASLHEREFVLGSTHVVVCDRGLDMHTAMRRGVHRTRQCRVLYFEVHGDFNAADRTANASVSALVAPPVRSQCARYATGEKPRRTSGAIHTGETARAWTKTGCGAGEGGA